MSVIGLMCKRGDTFSLQVLIGRGLFLLFLLISCLSLLLLFFCFLVFVGVFIVEVPPVPIPNTVVKLFCAYNTWLVTAREDWSMPTLIKTEAIYSFCFCSIRAISSVG